MKLVYGVGINDADYVVKQWKTVRDTDGKQKTELVWECTYYRTWKHMLERCYSAKVQARCPSYIGCSVCEEWLLFSNFKSWMQEQDWEGKHLDKDILFPGNRVYSSDTCVFISQKVNSFIVERGASRGKWPIGVYWRKEKQKFVAQCGNPFTNKNEHLGYFVRPGEAHRPWLKRKLELAYLLAAQQDDPKVAKALVARYSEYELQWREDE